MTSHRIPGRSAVMIEEDERGRRETLQTLAGGPLRRQDMHETLGLGESALGARLRKMEALGLVRRERVPGDLNLLWSLTDAGRVALESHEPIGAPVPAWRALADAFGMGKPVHKRGRVVDLGLDREPVRG